MARSRRPTIVIADDDGVARSILRLMLKEDDYDVVAEVLNGEDAVETCAKLQPDVVCLDVMMPKLNGIEALKAIREKSPHTVALMITGDAATATVKDALQNGASGYVLKPYNVGRVTDAIERALKK